MFSLAIRRMVEFLISYYYCLFLGVVFIIKYLWRREGESLGWGRSAKYMVIDF